MNLCEALCRNDAFGKLESGTVEAHRRKAEMVADGRCSREERLTADVSSGLPQVYFKQNLRKTRSFNELFLQFKKIPRPRS